MKRVFAFFLLLPVFALAQQPSYVRYVNPLMGTAASTTISATRHGAGTEHLANVIPAVGLPFGMLQVTPQTRTTEKKCQAPYYYKDPASGGYRLTHWLSGSCTQDYGSVTIFPVNRLAMIGGSLPLDHDREISQPHYYKNELGSVKTEFIPTLRGTMLRFTMLQDDSLYILITPNSDKAKGTVVLHPDKGALYAGNPVHRIYQGSGQPAGFDGKYYMEINATPAVWGTFSGKQINPGEKKSYHQKDGGAYFGMYAKKGTVVLLKAGNSFTGDEGAYQNLRRELPGWNFDSLQTVAKNVWDKALGQMAVTTNNEKDKRIFYTSLYHAMQHPRLMSDENGSYPRFAGNYNVEQSKDAAYYDDFSMWDIYRAQLPLVSILQPQLINDFVKSLILKGHQGGWLPIFPCWNSYTAAMIGDHSTAFIASAYNRGIRNYDINAAYELMRRNALVPAPDSAYKNGQGRRALDTYLKYGYVPLEDSVWDAFHKREQVSRTLEYAFDDYALGTIAAGLNKKDDLGTLYKHAGNYRNVFDKSVGLMNGRHADGRFAANFHPDKKLAFITEGTPRQYTFYVPQDIRGLAALMGGQKAFEHALDSLFEKGEYWHGNEPGHHIPFLYNYTASPHKTQDKVARILEEEYSDGIGGMSGNDDAGQMSAWYVFAAAGMYPADPVSGEYLLCKPIFERVDITLPNGKHWIVETKGKGKYIGSIQLNGKPYAAGYVTHQTLSAGGTMLIQTTGKPASWGTTTQPSSLTGLPAAPQKAGTAK